MNILEEFNIEFIKRHDFYSDDLNLLASKWPQTEIKNIPEAWIIPIDEMLLRLSNINIFPVRVEQKFGMLFVNYRELTENEHWHYNELPDNRKFMKIQGDAVIKIELIDEDLYLLMDTDLYCIDNEYRKIYYNQINYN